MSHAQSLGSCASGRPGRLDVAAPGPHQDDPAGRSAAPPDRRLARAAGVFEPGACGARGLTRMSSPKRRLRSLRWLDQALPPAIILAVLLIVWQPTVRPFDLPP